MRDDQVELEIADAQHRLLRHGRAAPRQRLDACQQFGERERLDQIVVAAAAQAAHAIVDLAERADDQGRRIDPGLAQLADDGQAVHARQHAVDGHHRVGVRRSQAKSVVAVVREIDLIAARPEEVDELRSRLRVVLDDQYAAARFGQCRVLRSSRQK